MKIQNWYLEGLRASKLISPLGVIKQKEMKNDKGREGGPKIGKNGRRRLWMALNAYYKLGN